MTPPEKHNYTGEGWREILQTWRTDYAQLMLSLDVFRQPGDTRTVGEKIAREILSNNYLRRVLVVGEPGSGKTILSSQIAQIAEDLGKQVHIVRYDDFLKKYTDTDLYGPTETWGKSGLSIEEGLDENEVRGMLSQELREYVDAIEEGTLAVIEGPVVGLQDRLTTALFEWIQEESNNTMYRTIVVSTVADPYVGEISGDFRRLVGNSSSLKELEELLEIQNKERKMIGQNPIRVRFPAVARNSFYWRNIVTPKFRTAANTREIFLEGGDEVMTAVEAELDNPKFIDYLLAFRINEEISHYPTIIKEQMKHKAAYTKYFLVDVLGLKTNQVFIIANLVSPQVVRYTRSMLESDVKI